jgi:hypothetical protein
MPAGATGLSGVAGWSFGAPSPGVSLVASSVEALSPRTSMGAIAAGATLEDVTGAGGVVMLTAPVTTAVETLEVGASEAPIRAVAIVASEVDVVPGVETGLAKVARGLTGVLPLLAVLPLLFPPLLLEVGAVETTFTRSLITKFAFGLPNPVTRL